MSLPIMAPSPLASWQNFYVIVGSSAGALIGLQFVVVALVGNMRRRVDAESHSAFGTPTVVHFATTLTISAIIAAPWPSLAGAALALVVCGVSGLAAVGISFRRARRQTQYKPIWEDWLWYTIGPAMIYTTLAAAALVTPIATEPALFIIAGCALGLLFVGIHNAWDTVTYIVVSNDGE